MHTETANIPAQPANLSEQNGLKARVKVELHDGNDGLTAEANGNGSTITPHHDETDSAPPPLINQTDLLRLIIQSLHSLDQVSIAKALQEASGVQLYSSHVAQFRTHILNGEYDVVLQREEYFLRQTLRIHNEQHISAVKLLILTQQYLELLETNSISEALAVLRKNLTPILQESQPEELHHLASLLLCQNTEELYERANWEGTNVKSRHTLINSIQKYVDPQILIPENRLEQLLLQAVEYQKEHLCVLQNPQNHDPSQGVSLLQREIAPEDAIPDTTLAVLTDHEDEVWNVQFSHNGQYLATVGTDKMCFVYNVHSLGAPFRSLKGHGEAVSVVAWSPNDKYLLTISQDRKAKVWDVAKGECIATFEKCTTACAWLPNSQEILVGGGNGDRHIYRYNIHSKETIHQHLLSHPIQDMDLSADGTRLVVVNRTKSFHVYYPNDMSQHFELSETDFITSVKLSPCGRYALLNISLESSSSRVSRLDMWDLEKRKKVREYEGHVQSRFVIRSCWGGNNGCFVVSGSEKNEVLVWLAADATLLAKLGGHTSVVSGVSCNARYTTMFASASDDHTVRVYHCSKDPFPQRTVEEEKTPNNEQQQ